MRFFIVVVLVFGFGHTAWGQALPDSLVRKNRIASVRIHYGGPKPMERLQQYNADGLCAHDVVTRNDSTVSETFFRYHKTDRYFLAVDSSRWGTWKKYTYPLPDKDSVVLLGIFQNFTDTAVQIREFRNNGRLTVTRFLPPEGIDSVHTHFDDVGDVMKTKSFRGKVADSVMYEKVFVTNDVTMNFFKVQSGKKHVIVLTRYNKTAGAYERKEIIVSGQSTVVTNVFAKNGLVKKQTVKINPKEKPRITAWWPYGTYDTDARPAITGKIRYRYKRRLDD